MPRRLTLDQLAAAFTPGETIYIPGSAGEPTPLLEHWRSDPERTRGLRILTSFVPGINGFDIDALHDSAIVTGLFMQPAYQAAQAAGRFRHLPLPYSGFVRTVRESPGVDTCLVHVAPPDAAGRYSLGPAVEFTSLVQAKSRRTIALVNPALPTMPGAAFLAASDIDAVVEVDFAPSGYAVGTPSRTALRIAGHIARFVDDGCTLQAGLGKVPDALLSLLHGRRRLRLHSGMLSDSALALWDAGALDPDAQHASCVWVGSAALYDRLRGWDGPLVLGCERTHDAALLASLDRFIAVNSALSVDLFGQANLEMAGGQAVSGIGGASDFARGARASPGGISIVALPSSFAANTSSRIVPRLDGVASLGRTDIDVVITEHGAADFRGRSVHERAEALIAIAAPALQPALAAAWQDIRRQL
jgi:acyl-CoA hydrolase